MKEEKNGREGDLVGERDEGNIQGSFAIISAYWAGDTGVGHCAVL